jgi:hypothetical protein
LYCAIKSKPIFGISDFFLIEIAVNINEEEETVAIWDN